MSLSVRSWNVYHTRAAVESCTDCLFFFQAEDGIRDATVTGVQTCALPISSPYYVQTPKTETKERRYNLHQGRIHKQAPPLISWQFRAWQNAMSFDLRS